MTKTIAERQKTKYFSDIAIGAIGAFALHRERGLWSRTPEGKRDWGNVSEHCLVEAARVGIFADLLGFSADLKDDLVKAAAVHDFYKKDEVAKLRANGTSWEAYADAQQEAKVILDTSSLSQRAVRLATCVGHETIPEAEELATKPDLTDEDKAWLVMHYADDYTVNAEWAKPATLEEGKLVNDLTRRMQQNKQNAQPGGKYEGIHRAGVEHFGEPTYDAQERVGELVQGRVAALVSASIGQTIEPAYLPEYIDSHIAERISQVPIGQAA